MSIEQIKQHLTIAQVLEHYGHQPDRNNMLHCPFHEDKTPSMKVYAETNTVYCFSSNCKLHSKSIDQIDFILHQENITKHEAIIKAQSLLGHMETNDQSLEKLFKVFQANLKKSDKAQAYLQSRSVKTATLEIGFNASTWPQLKHCIIFPLRDKEDNIVSFYGRSIYNHKDQRHYYTTDRKGLYPCWPRRTTQTLILTEAVIDAATLYQLPEITTDTITILACYGTNGFTKDHDQAISELKHLQEVILFFDGDEAGKKAVQVVAEKLHSIKPELKVSYVETPDNEDVNSLVQSHEAKVLNHLIENRKQLFFSSEASEKKSEALKSSENINTSTHTHLNISNPHNLIYKTDHATYYIKGGVSKLLDSMKITLVIEEQQSKLKSRNKVDLYEDKQVEKLCKEVSEKLNIRKDLLEGDLYKLTDQLDEYREKELEQSNNKAQSQEETKPLTAKEKKELEEFYTKPQLIKRINELLGHAGITGEEKNRIFLFIIALSYKMPETLHALIQGSSGSGKTRLLKQISQCMPQEKVTKLTRISDKVLYNYPREHFVNRLLCLEDIDGLSEEAEFALRELQSNGELNSATSSQLENGQIVAGEKTVKGPIASLACTTHGELYEDNVSRVFLIAVDESNEQTKRIIQYQNDKAAGLIDEHKEQQTRTFLQNFIRELKPHKVLNAYANKIQLPEEAHKIRRLNELFQSFVKMVTLINQYQRRKDERGRLITEIEDVETAVAIMFETIVLKVDELDGSLRQFYERLKEHLKKIYNGNHTKAEFTLREIRQGMHLSKTQLFRYANDLIELEYIQVVGGHINKGFKYKISYWDNYQALREKIKDQLQKQIENLKLERYGTQVER